MPAVYTISAQSSPFFEEVLSKLNLEPSTPINVHYQYDLTSSEDTSLMREKLENSAGNLKFSIHEIQNTDDESFNIFRKA